MSLGGLEEVRSTDWLANLLFSRLNESLVLMQVEITIFEFSKLFLTSLPHSLNKCQVDSIFTVDENQELK